MTNSNSDKIPSRSEDEIHEQIGSNGSTPPPGIATPRPDPSDKRLPGIIHGYFGQVRESSNTGSSTPDCSALATSALDMGVASYQSEHHRESMFDGQSIPATLSSPPGQAGGKHTSPSLFSHEQVMSPSHEGHPHHEGFHVYPTPPVSSPSSLHKEAKEDDSTDGASYVGDVQHKENSGPKGCNTTPDTIPLMARRHTPAIPNPLSSITTNSTVHAAHISNPTSRPTTPSTPHNVTLAFPDHVSTSSSYNELKKLTEGAAASPRKKNTPPHTPRALSNDVSHSEKQAPTSSVSPTLPGVPEASADGNSKQDTATEGATTAISPPLQGSSNAATATVGPPKGKLSVRISEARGLRPSYDPYVVCVFEYNEYISKGPKDVEVDMERDDIINNVTSGNGVAIRRSGSDMGKPMAIPMKSRQSSNTSISDQREHKNNKQVTNPKWDHEAIFDVIGDHSEIDFFVHDRSNQEAFLGHVRFCPHLTEEHPTLDGWFKLGPRGPEEEHVPGEVYLQMKFQKTDKKHFGPDDFQILKLIGKGTFGQVYQVRKKDTQRIYAMKVLSKKVIVQKKEVAHTLGERNILVRTATADSPFIVGLKFSFQTPTDLYLVTDYMSGGELFWHLQKEGRFHEGRAKFYIAELILALQHLHQYDIVYRDLKPENILLDATGHIALCDFGLSKANLTKNDTTNTFCGTTEYLAPEVLLDEQGYTKMVDFWSLGVLVFEMCCGWSPFYAEDTQQMYKNIAFGKVRFPRDALSTEGRNFVKGLLNRNPKHRLGATHDAEELKAHPFFADIDWDALLKKNVVPPFKPKLKSVLDTSNFDPEFTNALTGASSLNARAAALASGAMPASTPLSPGMQANFKGFTFVDESTIDDNFRHNDLEKMEEDEKEEDSGWEEAFARKDKREDRMSGIIKTGGGDDGVFNNGNFDI
ncbi:MAG: hypothetical protein M1827_002818 [Pycnora praestabilis]|nr:MAG: hypothetical protein M1827_002818 [Pycnora praestabilis]